ncbi:hypothetical protein SAMN04487958_10337 [Vreelandella subterranea]|uniref:Collagen triple helix repeat-containing protein n=1 Tax=Vreelandella subterranea TaxID=416874 RepID=A0A1H9S3C2_9GAMM|nr:hypothetical protein [Halomonas subterranea]SER79491.1 hypothetical protein SAMN04487958_10337 [Halomonas subterranea]
MKLYRFNGQSSVLAALLLSGALLAGCGQEEDVEGTAVPEATTQDQQNNEAADGASTQDDQFVSEQENDPAMESEAGLQGEPGMEGEPASGEPAQGDQSLTGDATEEPGFGDGTDPMPGDGEDASDLSANDSDSVDSSGGDQSENADSEEEDSSQ